MEVFVSFFEIYGPKCQDLLNGRHRLAVREDGRGEVHVTGLAELPVGSAAELLEHVARGNRSRTTQATESNDTSSRSHAICQVTLRRASGRLLGKLSLVDLAGSERGQDTRSHNRQLRTESAEINKSLLALKECIRGIESGSAHVPFRASKLTMVLRDYFVRPRTRVAMIATVSPGASAADHTINTLRYGDRIKEKPTGDADEAGTPGGATPSGATPGGGAAGGGGSGGGGAAGFSVGPAARAPSTAAQPPPSHRLAPGGEQRGGIAPRGRRDGLPPTAEAKVLPGAGGGAKAGNGLAITAAWVTGGGDKPPAAGPLAKDDETVDEPFEEESDDDRAPGRDGGDEAISDVEFLQRSLGGSGSEAVAALHATVENLFDEEEALLNLHMGVIQENAELLTEEGRLLQNIQGDDIIDYDIDAYTGRLQEILHRKTELNEILQQRLTNFRRLLRSEEAASRAVAGDMPLV